MSQQVNFQGRRSWTDADIHLLTSAWLAGTGPTEIAEMLGRTTSAIQAASVRLGLVGGRTPSASGYLARPKSENVGMRMCMRCRRQFRSIGSENRMCRNCKR